MSDFDQNPFLTPAGTEAFSGAAKASFDSMSKAFSGWLQNASRVQAETIRFVNDRFNKDMKILSRFSTCKKPEDVVRIQAEVVNELVNDYLAEGSRLAALFADAAAGDSAAAKSAGASPKK